MSGVFRQIRDAENDGVVRIRNTPPIFPPRVWNVREATLNNRHRTNNFCEAWNNGYQNLVGHYHPSMEKSIDCIGKEESVAHLLILHDKRGEPPRKRIRLTT